MRLHEIKILSYFADMVVSGEKTFEIRKNDRCYQKGDVIRFTSVDFSGLPVPHSIDYKKYLITCVLPYYGIETGYVVMGIKEIM